VRGSLLDLTPLHVHPVWRRLWIGTAASGFGTAMAGFAVAYVVWETTRSTAWVGVTAAVQAVPLVVFALVGGTVADAVDRRRLVLGARLGQLLCALGLAAVVLAGVDAIWPLLVLVGLQSTCGALGAPAARTFAPRLLPAAHLPAGLALQHVAFQAAMLVGPALAGVLTGLFGVAVCFVVDAATFVVALYGVWGLPAMRPVDASGAALARPGARAVVDGVRLVRRTPVLGGAFATDLAATLLAMPMSLFPAINAERLGGAPETLGLLTSAVAVGGVGASVLSGRFTRAPHPGRVMAVAAGTWGLALAVFGVAQDLWLVVLALAVAGAADTVSVVCRATLVQVATPDVYRGRVSAMEHLVGAGGPDLGNLRGGLVASVTSTGVAATSGGLLAALLVGVVAWRVPQVRRFRMPGPDGAA
jgi:MFS family permease